MQPLTIAEPSPNHPRDASDYAEIIAEIAAAGNQNCRDPAFLREQINSILKFYAPVVRDPRGGFHNQLLDDGTVYDPSTKHVVGTCRFIVNYALAARVAEDDAEVDHHLELCTHGVNFLINEHVRANASFWLGAPRLSTIGWVLSAKSDGGFDVADGTVNCYAVAFSLLALANAHLAGVAGVLPQLTHVLKIAERFYEEDHRLFIDSFNADGEENDYRGQNANMHMCEALIAVYEATGDRSHLDRAVGIAHCLTIEFATVENGQRWVHEHYTSTGTWPEGEHWVPDYERGKGATGEEHIFRPYGRQPGHSFEWVKLLLLLERHASRLVAPGRDPAGHPDGTWVGWILPVARELFNSATAVGWDAERGGLFYTLSADGVIDGNKYYWAVAEMIAAAGLLALRLEKVEEDEYKLSAEAAAKEAAEAWAWYDRAWAFALENFIDTARGGWYPVIGRDNVRFDPHAPPGHTGPMVKSYPSKTDYHPLAACVEVLRALDGSLVH